MSEAQTAGGWVRITARKGFNFIPAKKAMTATKYAHGWEGRLNAEAYGQAIASGKAEAIPAPTTREEKESRGGGKA